MTDPWHCRQIPNGDNPVVVCEAEELRDRIESQRARIAELEAALEDEVGKREMREDMCDLFSGQIGRLFGADVGEHSNTNDPWQNAMELVLAASPGTAETQPTPEDAP